MNGRIIFFRHGAPPIVAAIDLPGYVPCRVELPNAAVSVDPSAVQRVVAFIGRTASYARQPGEDDAKLTARSRRANPAATVEVRGDTCVAVWEEPLTVKHWERLYAPRRWFVELAMWESAPGQVSTR